MLRQIIEVIGSSPVLLYVIIGASCALAVFTVWLTWYLAEYHENSLISMLLVCGGCAIFIGIELGSGLALAALLVLIVLYVIGVILWMPILLLLGIVRLFENVPSPPRTITPTQRITRIVDSTSTEMDALSSDYQSRVDALIAQSRQKSKER